MWMQPNSIHFLGYVVDGLMYFDVTLSMGSKSAAYCCQRTTSAVMYIYHKAGYEGLNYLDDLGSAKIESLAETAYKFLGEILNRIGIVESEEKAQPPSCIATFLGVLFNTILMTMLITPDRLREINGILSQWKGKTSATLRDLQQLLGKLNFVCNTVRAGRVFVSRLINLLKGFPKKGKRRLSKDFQLDIDWWLKYMKSFDGIVMIPKGKWYVPDVVFSVDSCLTGCGG